MTNQDLIRFPGLGIELKVGQYLELFGVFIAYYGLLIAVAFVICSELVYRDAKKTGQKVDDYSDFFVFAVISSIIGARLYYVIFEWDYYKKNVSDIFNLRSGGLAIYGGIIAVLITLYVYSKKKKLRPLLMMDTAIVTLPLGQAIGRWGNFFNREAFGGYYAGRFRMEIPIERANGLTDDLISKAEGGFVSVHPTFLYESVWNLVGFAFMFFFLKKHKSFEGEMVACYMLWYGIGRAMIEGLRTDQLKIGATGIAVSQVLSVLIAVAGAVWIVVGLKKSKNNA